MAMFDFEATGWLAIDPKGLPGKRGFDYANLFCNPDGMSALVPGRFVRRGGIILGWQGWRPQRLI